MVAIFNGFESTDLKIKNMAKFEEFFFGDLLRNVCSISLIPEPDGKRFFNDDFIEIYFGEDDPDADSEFLSRENVIERLRQLRDQWPVSIVEGEVKDTLKIYASGDSDNGDDTYFDDRDIAEICRHLTEQGLFCFHRFQFPSNDTDDIGGVSFWIYEDGELAHSLHRDWTAFELDQEDYHYPELPDFCAHYIKTKELCLYNIDGKMLLDPEWASDPIK